MLNFFSKRFKFDEHFRNAIKNPEKVFSFQDIGVGSCCWKLCILQRIYPSSAVSVLTNSLIISDQTKAGFLQLNLSGILGKIQ